MRIHFSEHGKQALEEAQRCAARLGHPYLGSEHLLLGLIRTENGAAGGLLKEAEVSASEAEEILCQFCPREEGKEEGIREITPRAGRILQRAAQLCAGRSKETGTEWILLALLSDGDSLAMRILGRLQVDGTELYRRVKEYIREKEAVEKVGEEGRPSKGKTAGKYLSQYGTDLTEQAAEGKLDPMIGREKELERVIQILSRRTKNNPCLIGEPGVGKTAIAEGLAQKIASGEAPELLAGKRVISLDLAAMVAGSKYRGEFEERIKNLMDEAMADENVILFIDEIHTVVGAGASEGSMDASNILKPALARGKLQVIGATTLAEYRTMEKDAALERRFQSVTVGEPSPEEAVLILKGLREKYEAHHHLTIPDAALEAAVTLSHRYISDRFLPDKAIDLIDEACSRKRIRLIAPKEEEKALREEIASLEEEKKRAVEQEEYESAGELLKTIKEKKACLEQQKQEKKECLGEIHEEDVAQIVTLWTGIPVNRLMEEEAQRLGRMEEILSQRVKGQKEAIGAVSRAIRRSRTGLKDPKRPVGSFLFCGPTGVGKTELCRAIAQVMFGSEDKLIRLDMSEYMEKHSVSKFIGSPPGYVGFDEGGQLTEKVRRHPYSVILFDEIEKAHPDVFNLLLQVLEDGVLSDSHGRRVDFKNTVIVLTSNCGASELAMKKPVGFASGTEEKRQDRADEEAIHRALKASFRPEFLNRLDEIIVFHRLSQQEITEIAENMLSGVQDRVKEKGYHLTFSREVAEKMAQEGFDPVYGARPLRRAIQKRVEDSLASFLLEGSFVPGDEIRVILEDGEIRYRKEEKEA